MTNNGVPNADGVQGKGLSAYTAKIMEMGSFGTNDPKELRASVNRQIDEALKNHQISGEEAKAAKKFLDNNLAGALARRNEVGVREYNAIMYNEQELSSAKATDLMKSVGLNVEDLADAAHTYAGWDLDVNYSFVSKEKRKASEKGDLNELTESELTNITNDLNKRIKEAGGEKLLRQKDAKVLMEGLGLSVESKLNIGRIFTKIGLGGLFGGILGGLTKSTAKAKAVAISDSAQTVVATAATAGGGLSGAAIGAAGGVALGLPTAIYSEIHRTEKPQGPQGGPEGGNGSPTNKLENKVADLTRAQNTEIEKEEE